MTDNQRQKLVVIYPGGGLKRQLRQKSVSSLIPGDVANDDEERRFRRTSLNVVDHSGNSNVVDHSINVVRPVSPTSEEASKRAVKSVDFDVILKHIGEMGPYQLVLYLMMCIPATLPAAFLAFNQEKMTAQ